MTLALIVDDDAVSLAVHAHILTKLGVSIRTADGYEGAVRLLAQERVDVIVCDAEMTGGTGLDLFERLEQHADRPAFVLVTGESEREDLGDARAERVDAFLSKPASSAELGACVTAALERHAAAH